MKGRPIIMSSNHPKLILDGIKTQTRRTARLNELNKPPDRWKGANLISGNTWFFNAERWTAIVRCPYGQVGSRLWVRETWKAEQSFDNNKPSNIPSDSAIYYICDNVARSVAPLPHNCTVWFGKVRPSIFMPRWASRITLEITEVRVERQLDITLQDAIAEGFSEIQEFNETFLRLNPHLKEVNPWVWVISFKVV